MAPRSFTMVPANKISLEKEWLGTITKVLCYQFLSILAIGLNEENQLNTLAKTKDFI